MKTTKDNHQALHSVQPAVSSKEALRLAFVFVLNGWLLNLKH